MKYYIYYDNGAINGCGCCEQLTEGVENIEVTEEVYNNFIEDNDRYIYSDGEIIENPNYEEVKRQKEQERINNLIMTAQDLLDLIHNLGASWDAIDEYLNEHKELKLRLTTCQNVFCGVLRQLLPLNIDGIEITDEMVVRAFKVKNDESPDVST